MQSSLPSSRLRGLEASANADYTGALVSGIVAGLLGAVSIIFFASGS